MWSEFLTHECSAGQRCQADQRQLLCWIQQTPWSEMVENINSHTERQTHNCGRIPINCRGEQEEDWTAMSIPVYCRRREGFGWGRGGGVGPTGRHSRIDPSQGTTHFCPSVDGSCKFGCSSKVGVGQFSTTRAKCDSNFRTCVQWSGPSEQI